MKFLHAKKGKMFRIGGIQTQSLDFCQIDRNRGSNIRSIWIYKFKVAEHFQGPNDVNYLEQEKCITDQQTCQINTKGYKDRMQLVPYIHL